MPGTWKPATNSKAPIAPSMAVMPSLVRMDDLGLADWQDLPRVVTWYKNIRAHPSFAPTFYPGSLLSERFPHLREQQTKSA